ncbi:MAG TPA: hypothetical protein VKR29_09380 [Candidatus Binataceae bacterium]|nr:hypothetical protein [Candidatus Binataceae bacterium]
MLGAYHGVDPSMGWLFAVALGLQDRSRARVLWALLPIAIGHLLSIATVVAIVGGLRMASFNADYIRYGGAAVLIAFGVFRLIWPHAHPRWVAMRVNAAELGLWSFLMASAHGAGLMLFPILMNVMPMHHSMHHHMPQLGTTLATGALVTIVHTSAMLVVMGAIAIVIYEKVGLAILRSAWINLDVIWASALIAAGMLSVFI